MAITPLYQPGEAEQKLEALYAERERAFSAWDATEYNRIDGEIRCIFAAMRDEVRLGLREDPIFTCTLVEAA